MNAKILAALCLLVACATVVTAIVCEEDFCDKVKCEDLSLCEKKNGGLIRTKGSYCGCCDICVRQLREGDSCNPEDELLLGIIAGAECARGLICDPSTRTCIRLAF
uniref:U6-Hypotoxin-Hsp1a_1 n=1 Tax=Hypochilus sp. SGP-2016 TaxID=1905178 RepID=A0A482Z8U4_9ARAC